MSIYSILKPAALSLICCLAAGTLSLSAQTSLPGNSYRSLQGEEVILSELADGTAPVVIIFWASWCKPCVEELDIINAYLETWKSEVDFRLVTVNTDDSRTSGSVRSFVSGKGWSLTVIPDHNQELMRTMNVTDIPFYYIFDSSGKLKVRHTGYAPGDEEFMLEEIKRIGDEAGK